MTTPADTLFDRLSRALADRYAIERELGRGGMAAVFLATDLRLGRQVAIKVLPPEARETLGVERFQREVQLAARLSHPHIVPVFEAGEADGVSFYVMGYVEGETLKDKLAREGPLPLDEAVRLTAEIGEALQYAHEHGVIHRDVKPANILLARGHAQVADFGIAKAMEASAEGGGESLTATGVSIGTAEYMSPEQAAGERRIDARSDVYALASLLYEMLAGEPPFSGPTVQAIVARVIADPPRPLRTIRPNLPPEIESAVNAGLAKMPADRPASAQVFVERLTTRATPPTRRRPVFIVVAVLLLAGATITGLWVIPRHRPVRAPAPTGMLLVPGGTYRTGGGARPEHSVVLDSFYIDSTEVTVSAYQQFVMADSSQRRTAPWRSPPDPQWPVTGVLWTEAQRFCAWRARGALPTEDQWEAAARGPQGWTYPWGNVWESGRANAESAVDTLTRVGRYTSGRSPVGAVDMIGNAWEWVDAEEPGPAGEIRHIAKGGAFNTKHQYATGYFRSALPDDRAKIWLTGFRCARSVKPQG